MTCHDARELFSALLDDALHASERAALDTHLAGCAECRRELERFRGTVALLHAVEPARAPAGFVDRVLAAARPAPWHRRLARAVFLPWPVKLPLEAAAIVLVGAAVALVFRATPELDQMARVEPPPRATEAPRGVEPAAPPPAEAPAPRPAAEPEPPAEPRTRDKVADAAAPRREYAPALGAPREAPLAKRDLEAPKSTGEGERARQLEGRSAPAEKKAPAPAGLVAPLALTTPPRADVAGRLAVADRDAAERALAQLLARVRGREVARRTVPGGAVVEVALPRAAFPEFARGLEAIGRWQPARAPGDLPAEVRVEVAIGD